MHIMEIEAHFGTFFYRLYGFIKNNYPRVTSGNCTPGSRSYSDLLDTWVDCLHLPACIQVMFEGNRLLA